jgi:hypothetical protein
MVQLPAFTFGVVMFVGTTQEGQGQAVIPSITKPRVCDANGIEKQIAFADVREVALAALFTMGNGSSCPRSATCRHHNCDVDPARTTLLDLDDHLLCEILKSVSTYDKRQHVQRACMRFREVLQRPSFSKAWGSVAVILQRCTDIGPDSVLRLITWLLERKSGTQYCSMLSFRSRHDMPGFSDRRNDLVAQQASPW